MVIGGRGENINEKKEWEEWSSSGSPGSTGGNIWVHSFCVFAIPLSPLVSDINQNNTPKSFPSILDQIRRHK